MQIKIYISNMQKYIERAMDAVLRVKIKNAPAVVLYGPRQCGKSTLARHDYSTFSDRVTRLKGK